MEDLLKTGNKYCLVVAVGDMTTILREVINMIDLKTIEFNCPLHGWTCIEYVVLTKDEEELKKLSLLAEKVNKESVMKMVGA